jgi:putative membrane protein
MKRALLFAAAAATALTLAACQKQRDQTANAAGGVANSPPVSGTQDATSAAVGAASANTVGAVSTDGFVTGLVTSGMYEIQAGKIAETKAQSPAVKAFGKMMVTDHTAMSKEADPAVKASGKPIPTELDQRRKGLIDNLNGAKPADFDKEYLSQQEAAHKEALDLLKGYADHGDDAGLKTVASGAIPKVQAHLDKVHELQAAAPK